MALSRPDAGAADTAHDHGFHPLRIARVIKETSEAKSYVLEVPDELSSAFRYDAGQFCTFRVKVNGEQQLRCYSMSSSPATDADFQVTVKRTPGGVVSNWMHDQLAAGDTIEVTRPAGVFCLRPGGGDVVAFSAGSGITPVISLVKSALTTTTGTVRLFYANRDHEAVIFRSEINALQVQHGDRLSVAHHLDVERGLATPEMIGAFTGDAGDADCYICGPGLFMDIVEGALVNGGIAAERIHIERFTPTEAPVELELSTDTGSGCQVTVTLAGREHTTEHHPGTTILQTARQMGLSPPFSCEAGSCATCMARLTEGAATMHVNNALTDDEVEEGWVLTCQAVPTGPSIRVIYEEG